MTLYMRDMENRRIGEEIGKEIGEKIGEFINKISLIRKKKNKYDEDVLVDLYDVDKSECKKIIYYIDNYPDWSDKDIANEILNGDNKEQ